MKLVIVESPSKAKTINKYLGNDFKVLASYGHVRDLPSKNNSVRPEEDFAMDWEVQQRGQKTMQDIVRALSNADSLYLASDPDREGEAIAWHVLQELKRRKKIKKDFPVFRVVFHEITKKAIQEAIAHPKDIDMNLVDAYMARRALDYLVGFTVSPLLWKKLPGAKSAGRVQSVALRLICEREEEIQHFNAQEYWTIGVDLLNSAKEEFTAHLTHLDGHKLDKFDLANATDAALAQERIHKAQFIVQSLEKKQVKRNPAPPFTTSTLQQEASRKLGFGAKKTMQVAQQLYEGGFITYMRTDAVALASEAVAKIRDVIQQEYGTSFLPDTPRIYKNTIKNAQEAHEAIRPTDITRVPQSLNDLTAEQQKLYTLIFKRTMACQMASATFDQVGADIISTTKDITLRATGQTLTFAGFIKVYKEDIDDAKEDDEKTLPALHEGESLTTKDVQSEQHFTEPSPRFTEASLVKKMEELGIGRPSTYASILSVLQEREYVKLLNKRFIPELRGKLVTAFLKKYFTQYVQYDYTAQLEAKLDDITNAVLPWKKVLVEFWGPFNQTVQQTEDIKKSEVLTEMTTQLNDTFFKTPEERICPECHQTLEVKYGRYGAFIGCSGYPKCTYIKTIDGLDTTDADNETSDNTVEDINLGTDDTGVSLVIKKGKFGWYIQSGTGESAKRAALPKNLDIHSIDKERALAFLSLPKTLGQNTATHEEVKVGIGRYGPYVCQGKVFHSIDLQHLFSMTLDEALTLLSGEKEKRAVKTIGTWDGKEITFQTGRYGPYVKWGKVMASFKKDGIPTQDEAISLLKAKIGHKE